MLIGPALSFEAVSAFVLVMLEGAAGLDAARLRARGMPVGTPTGSLVSEAGVSRSWLGRSRPSSPSGMPK